jgi:predicted MFS family arabinose efflux permease
MQSTLQTWATDVVPEARGTATALTAGAASVGAALSSAALSGLAEAGLYRPLFWLAALAAAPVAGLSALLRGRFTARLD